MNSSESKELTEKKDGAVTEKKDPVTALADMLESVPEFVQSDMDTVIWAQMLANYGEMAVLADRLDSVLPGSSYLLDIPGSVAEGILSGSADALSGAAGDVLASVFEKVGGEKILRDVIPLKQDAAPLPATAVADLNDSLQHLAVQQQMAAFASQLESTAEAVKRIESGLRDDRYGEIIGARNQLYLASKAKDEANRRDLTRSAISQLSVGIGKLEKAIESGVHSFEPVPKNKLLVYWRMTASPVNYIEQKEQEYNGIKENVDVYREANNLMAAAYMMIDEPELAEEVYSMQGEFWDSLDFSRVQSISSMYRGADFSKEWCFDPSGSVAASKQKLLSQAADHRNVISIELTGEQLREVFGHDKDGQPGNTDE